MSLQKTGGVEGCSTEHRLNSFQLLSLSSSARLLADAATMLGIGLIAAFATEGMARSVGASIVQQL